MADPSTEERCRLAVKLVEQAPPGEVNDIINDIRAIIADDEALMPLIVPSLRAYNLSQLTIVEHPASDGAPAHVSLLSEAAIHPGDGPERYVDAIGKRSFAFDHATLAVSGFEPYELPEEEEVFRSELAKSLTAYTKSHFPSGHSSVSCSQHPLLPPQPPAAVSDPPVAQSEPEPSPVATSTSSNAFAESAEPLSVAEAATAEPVTDVVPEQVGTGEKEPAPTPAVGEAKKEEVDAPGGLEKLDEAVEAEKEQEEKQEAEESAVGETSGGGEHAAVPLAASMIQEEESPKTMEEPKVTEVTPEGAAAESLNPMTPSAAATQPVREQKRIDNPTYTLEVVGNRYNPSNFWTGRWRSRWIVDQARGAVEGTIIVDVHYYEQGNVQLATTHSVSFPCPAQASGSQSIASQIVTTISKLEAAYQVELNDVYADLGEKAFRALRRALPVTRQKMDWEKVSGYSLGADLTKARG